MASALRLRQCLRFSTVFGRSQLNLKFNRTNPIHTGRTVFGVQYAEAEAAKERSYVLKKQYIDLINGLGGAESPVMTEETAGGEATEFKDIKVTKENKVCTILLNRPEKKNAFSARTFNEIIQALDQASKDDTIAVAVITGAGHYYSTGLDLDIFMVQPKDIQEKLAGKARELVQRYVAALIDFPKPLLAALNGGGACIAVATLGLCDAVYASDKAKFHWQFSDRQHSLVGCSTYLFPKIMGNAKANELLLFSKKLTAREACERGLVTEVFPHDSFQKEVQARVNYIAQLPPKSMMESKKLIRDQEREKLHRASEKEAEVLEWRWKSEEFAHSITSFAANRAK